MSFLFGRQFIDGSKFYQISQNNDEIYDFDVSTPYDLTTATTAGNSPSFQSEDDSIRGMAWDNLGNNLFISGNSGDNVYRYSAATPYDLTTLTYTGDTFNFGPQSTAMTALEFSTNGLRMFLSDISFFIYEYSLSTGFDITTASLNDDYDTDAEDDNTTGIAFNQDGSKMFLSGNETQEINEYGLSTNFNISTSSHNNAFDISGELPSAVHGLSFNKDGTKMYVGPGDSTNEVIYEYDLSTPFDTTTATYNSNNLNMDTLDTNLLSHAWDSPPQYQ